MPELPEVETVRLGLIPVMSGRTIAFFEQRRDKLRWPLPTNMSERLKGVKILRLSRRAKYIQMHLDSDETLILHLGMSGRILVHETITKKLKGVKSFKFNPPQLEKHDHLVFHLDDGSQVIFNDPRRFGALDLVQSANLDSHAWLVNLGPEPLKDTFSSQYLLSKLSSTKGEIKTVLMDQKLVAGLGNIYVSEALWSAGISPLRVACQVKSEEVSKLIRSIKKVLKSAIKQGGTSLQDFRSVRGDLGYFQNKLNVYGRTGGRCRNRNCVEVIQNIKQGGRSSYFCKKCQR